MKNEIHIGDVLYEPSIMYKRVSGGLYFRIARRLGRS